MSEPVMLASPGRKPGEAPEELLQRLNNEGGWTFEVKWDGIRAVVQIDATVGVHITNRRGARITQRYPDLVAGLSGTVTATLDCEIVVMDHGLPSFELAHLRDAQDRPSAARLQSVRHPASLVPFDVLSADGVNLELLPYNQRRWHLQKVLRTLEKAGSPVLTMPVGTDGMAMWQVVREHGLEGLVAKRTTSRYRRRRSPDWVKIKATTVASVLVGGFTAGTGDRSSTFGNLHMKAIDEHGDLVDVGKVGSGFSDRALREMTRLLRTQAHPIVIDVEYLELSSTGHLRFPVFRGLRTDVDPLSCTLERLA